MNTDHGVGGSYVIDETGARKLVERTFDPNDPTSGDPPEAQAADQPATLAGFFSPEAVPQPTAPTSDVAADHPQE